MLVADRLSPIYPATNRNRTCETAHCNFARDERLCGDLSSDRFPTHLRIAARVFFESV